MTDHVVRGVEELVEHPLMRGTEYRLVKRHAYEPDMAAAMILGLSQFLYVVVESPVEVSPPVLIDEAWHDSLIDTRNYASMTAEYFGGMVHHNPPLSDQSDHRTARCLSVSETVDVALGMFGDSLERRVWRRSEALRQRARTA